MEAVGCPKDALQGMLSECKGSAVSYRLLGGIASGFSSGLSPTQILCTQTASLVVHPLDSLQPPLHTESLLWTERFSMSLSQSQIASLRQG
jgi:hypothetical protein